MEKGRFVGGSLRGPGGCTEAGEKPFFSVPHPIAIRVQRAAGGSGPEASLAVASPPTVISRGRNYREVQGAVP